MPDNPTTARPVTRSAEVEEALEDLRAEVQINGSDHAAELIAYIAQLEAQPKPQSDEGLRDLLKEAEEVLDWVYLTQAYVRTQGTGLQPPLKPGNPQLERVPLGEVRAILLSLGPKVEPVLNKLHAALSRQAPVPTQRSVPTLEMENGSTITFSGDGSDPLQGIEPVPTRGAVEFVRVKGDGELFAFGVTDGWNADDYARAAYLAGMKATNFNRANEAYEYFKKLLACIPLKHVNESGIE